MRIDTESHFWTEDFLDSALISCLFELGADRLMFASDYPWNAAELFGLDVADRASAPEAEPAPAR